MKQGIKIEKQQNILVILGVVLFILVPLYSKAEQASSFRYVIVPFVIIMFGTVRKFNGTPLIGWNELLAIAFWWVAFISTLMAGLTIERNIITFGLFILLYIAFSYHQFTYQNMKLMLAAYVLIAVSGVFVILLGAVTKQSYYGVLSARYSMNAIGLVKNPNYVTGFILFGYALILIAVIKIRRMSLLLRVGGYGVLLLTLLAFFLSGTRASIVGAALVTLFIVLCYAKMRKSMLILIVTGLIAAVLLPDILQSLLLEKSLARISLSNLLNDPARMGLWWEALNGALQTNVMFGMGFGGANSYVLTRKGHYLHNLILEIFLNFGIVGMGVFIAMVMCGMRKLKKDDCRLINLLTVALVFPMLFQNGMATTAFWLPVIIRRMLIVYSIRSEGKLHLLFS